MNNQRQPLSIKGQNNTHIRLDGPALRIAQKDQADQNIPLKRIEHINSFGNCKWETSALLKCAEEGINIYFCKQDGSLKAQLQPPMQIQQASAIKDLLNEQMNSKEKAQQFKQWLDNQKVITQLSCEQQLAQEYSIKKWKTAENLLDSIGKKHISSFAWKKLKKILYILIKTQISTKLWQDNIQPSLPIFQIHQIDLVSHIAQIIYSQLIPKILKSIKRKNKRNKEQKKLKISLGLVIQLQNEQQTQLDNLYAEHILQMHRNLLESKHAH